MSLLRKSYKAIKTGLFTPKSNGISILTYHGLVEEITNARLQRNFHTISQFEDHILLLKKKKFRFLNATELAYFIDYPKQIKGIVKTLSFRSTLGVNEFFRKMIVVGLNHFVDGTRKFDRPI
jgi:hypothetical protein